MSPRLRLPAVAFAFLLPLVFWPPFEDAFKLPQHVLLLLFAGWLAGRGRLDAGELLRRQEVAGVALATGLAMFASAEKFRAGDALTLSALIVTGWLLPGLLRSAGRVPVLPALAVSGAASAGYSVWQFAVGDPAGGIATRGLRPFSTMGNPDFLAAFLVAVFPWQVAAWLRGGSGWWAGAAGMTGAALLIAQSRGAWLGLAVGLLAFPVLFRLAGGRFAWSRRMLTGAAIAVLSAAGYLLAHEQSRERFLAMFRTGHFDAAGRFAMWHESAMMIADRPMTGHGPGAYGRIHPVYHAHLMARDPTLPWFFSENSHNDPLQIAAETGVVGLGAALWWLACVARLAWLAHRRADPDGFPVLLGLVGTGVNALFNFPWYLIPTVGWAWLAYAVLASRHGPSVPPGAARRRPWLPTAILLVAGIATGRMLLANGWLKLGGDFMASGLWAQALACAQRSDRLWLGWEGHGRVAGCAAGAAYGMGDFTAAERWARTGLLLDPASSSHFSQLGLSLARQQRIAEAEESVMSAIRLNPRMAEAWHTLGNLAWMRQDRESAGKAWRAAVSLNPGLTGAAQSLAALESTAVGRRPSSGSKR